MTDTDPTMPTDQPPTKSPVSDAPAPKKTAPKKKVKDSPGLRLDKRGTVTIQELARDLQINCTTARLKLRKAGLEKSLHGAWEWDKGSPEYKRVKKLLTA
jgi:hypothetical protein